MNSTQGSAVAVAVLVIAGAVVGGLVYFRSSADPAPMNNPAPAPPAATNPRPGTIPSATTEPFPVITVQVAWPLAGAKSLVDSVAAPLEEQIHGVEGATGMTSVSADGGDYTLQVTFRPGTNAQEALQRVQVRAALAQPKLPEDVKKSGVKIQRESRPLVMIALTSPDHSRDGRLLSNYANLQVKDQLVRIPGVGSVRLFGQHEEMVRVIVDREKLAAYGITITELLKTLREQNLSLIPLEPEGGFGRDVPGRELELRLSGRLPDPELGDVILKSTSEGAFVRLQAIGRVEFAARIRDEVRINGEPATALLVGALPEVKPEEVRQALDAQLQKLRADAPPGIALDVMLDFSTDTNHWVVDVELPQGASLERTLAALEQATDIARRTTNAPTVVALSEHPFNPAKKPACLLVGFAPQGGDQRNRAEAARRTGTALRDQLREAACRVSVPSTKDGFPVYGFPMEFALADLQNQGRKGLQRQADQLVDSLAQTGKFTDLALAPGSAFAPHWYVDIDREKCAMLGIDWQEAARLIPADAMLRAPDLQTLTVKGKQGESVSLAQVFAVRETFEPSVIERQDLYPVVWLTANIAADSSPAEARRLIQSLAEQSLDLNKFKLIWQRPGDPSDATR